MSNPPWVESEAAGQDGTIARTETPTSPMEDQSHDRQHDPSSNWIAEPHRPITCPPPNLLSRPGGRVRPHRVAPPGFPGRAAHHGGQSPDQGPGQILPGPTP